MKVIGKIKNLSSEGISTSYLVEDFLEGPLVSVEVLTVSSGIHQVLGIADRDVVASSVEIGSSFPVKPQEADAVIDLAKRALDAIGYTFGPSHIEIIITNSGPHLVEINTRVGGSGHSVMLDAALGRTVVGDCIELCLGTHDLNPDLYQPKQGAAWHCYTSTQSGILKSLPNESEVLASEGISHIWIHKQLGTQLKELESNFNWIFQVLCVGQNAHDAREKAKNAIELGATQVHIEEQALK
jgi:biotin carboxylase